MRIRSLGSTGAPVVIRAALQGLAGGLRTAPQRESARKGQAARVLSHAERVSSHLIPNFQHLHGRDAIVAAQPMLAKLAERSGQTGDADNLAHFLSTPDALKKMPHLLLFSQERPPEDQSGLDDDEVTGAVLLFEYQIGKRGSRVFSTADATGRRNVFGPSEARAQLAASAARVLIGSRAQIVHIAYCETHEAIGSTAQASGTGGVETRSAGEQRMGEDFEVAAALACDGSWSLLEREIPLYLALGPSFEATLARIGQRTRSNLRYYRRRSEAQLGCSFVPDVHLSLEDFLAFNRRCTYAVAETVALWRYNTLTTLFKPFLRGIRDAQGQWLSLVGGRRHGLFVEIDWQMNRADLPTYSLATVMRSYLIEYEIAAGSKRLYIEGGTPHPIGRSFSLGRVCELTLQRKSLYVRLLSKVAPKFFPAKNYLAQVLHNPALHWKRW